MGTKLALQLHHKCDADEQERASTLCFEYDDISEISRIWLCGIRLE